MANKKLSQLAQITPVPTGALMLLANSGVSRSASVRDVANAISTSNNTFSGLSDTPSDITGSMFVVSNADGTELTFSKDLHLGTGNYLDKTVGGTISGDVTMATGEKIYFANSDNFINSAGNNLAFRTDGFIKMRSTSGVNIYQVGGTESKLNYYTGLSDSHKVHVTKTNTGLGSFDTPGMYISSGLNHVLHSDTDISGKIFQSGKEIKTGDFALSSQTGIFVDTTMTGELVDSKTTGHLVGVNDTGILVGKNESGQFVGDHETGIFAEASKTGSFVAGSGVPANMSAKWSNTGILTSGITSDDGTDFYPFSNSSTNLGKNTNRWKELKAERVSLLSTGSTSDSLDSFVSLKSNFTGAAYSELLAQNSDSDFLQVGISSTGVLTRNIGSGNYYIKGGGTSGKHLIIGDRHDILFFANTGISVLDSESHPGKQNPAALKIHTSGLVTFSEAFTMPTGDGSSNQFLKTDGAGNVAWSNVSDGDVSAAFVGLTDTPANFTSSANKIVSVNSAANALEFFDTGHFIGANETGNLVGQHMTGHFADAFTGLKDVSTGVDGLPAGGYGTAGQLVVVNKHGNGLIYSGYAAIDAAGGSAPTSFTDLNDVDNNYAGDAGKVVVVNSSANGLEFFATGDFVGTSETGDFVDVHKSGALLVGVNMTGDLVDTDMTGTLVGTGMTGSFVTVSETGIFVDASTTGFLVANHDTGIFVDKHVSGTFVGDHETGIFVDIHSTGIFVDIHTSGTFVGDHETGNFLTELSESGTYGTQFDVTAAGGKFYLSEITAGSHITTSQVERPAINLHRGHTYKFRSSSSAASHPFFIASSPGGGGYGAEYTSGITNSRAAGEGQSLYFKVPQNAPERLYYECGAHSNMGGTIQIWQDSGRYVGTNITGNLFIDKNTTGFLVADHQTGDFYSKRGGDISGDVSILGSSGLYVSGDVQIQSGVSYHPPVLEAVPPSSNYTLNWQSGNVRFFSNLGSMSSCDFEDAKDGQTLTVSMINHTDSAKNIAFTSGTSPNAVRMPADADGNNNAPAIPAGRTNVYTFIRIDTGIYCSYVTGYNH